MTDIDSIADRYTAVWNEPDPDARRRAVAELWTDGAWHVIESSRFHGRDAIEQRIAEAYREFVAKSGFVFGPVGEPVGHHDAIKVDWNMAPAGGPAVATGFAFLIVGADGRIITDYQFINR